MATTTLIQTVTVGAGGAASIDFASIPNTFSDLVVQFSLRSSVSAGVSNVKLTFNGSTSSYSGRTLMGFGSGAGYGETNVDQYSNPWPFINFYANVGSTSTANTFSNGTLTIPNYAGNTNKSVSIDWVNETNATAAWSGINAGLWSNTAAITSLSLGAYSGTWVQGSTASLYGISKTTTNGTPKATGGTITYGIGGMVYHTFTASGTFTPTTSLTADVLIVGGGGGGGNTYTNTYAGGGGGAGGYRISNGVSFTATGYPVVIGAGGANYTNGSDSSFISLTSVGGGHGANGGGETATSGGSGGGGSRGDGFEGGAGSGTAGQGNSGGYGAVNRRGGGGGGAGAVGGNGSSGASGNGGIGTAWLDGNYYAGGGGGAAASASGVVAGTGGNGGGGTNSAGVANTGGGGAGGPSTTGYAGGSGVVIVRYQG